MSQRIALITGSATGLGRGIALRFAQNQIAVAINYRKNKSRAELLVEQIQSMGGRAVSIQADVSDPVQARDLIEQTVHQLGGLDILVNNAGDFLWKQTSQVTDTEFTRMIEENAYSVFYCTKAALPYMRDKHWGRIINLGMTNITRLPAASMMAGYTAAKAASVVLMRAFAKEEGRNGITSNMVCPGIIEDKELTREQARKISAPDVPVGRPGSWEDIADVILFLASDPAEFVTGQVLEVAGGWGL